MLTKLKKAVAVAMAFSICIPTLAPYCYAENSPSATDLREELARRNSVNLSAVEEIDDIDVYDSKGNTYIKVADLSSKTAEELVSQIMGEGVQITGVRYYGSDNAAGTFETDDSEIVGFNSGIILSSGDAKGVDGPNSDSGYTSSNDREGDQYLDLLIPGYETYDSTVLEFDFIPTKNMLSFEYAFSSEEYNEYVGSQFNDVFGFFLNGENIALVPDTNLAVAINNVNNGSNNYYGYDEDYDYDEDYGSVSASNPQYFRDNTDGHLNTEMDGLTTVLTAKAAVNVGQTNTIRLAIADAGDDVLDSNVFIKAASFTSASSGAIQFSNIGFDCFEEDGYATVAVSRTGDTSQTSTVSYCTGDGSASEGSDYTASSGILTFAPGVTNQTFSVPLTDDSTAEGIETINVFLKEATGNAFIGQNIQAKIYVDDSDTPAEETQEKTVAWDSKVDVPTNKNFIIKFNMEIDPGTVTPDNFYVTDSNGTLIPNVKPEIQFNNLSVIMKPESFTYDPASTYFLNIAPDVKTTLGKKLGKLVKMQFTTKDLSN